MPSSIDCPLLFVANEVAVEASMKTVPSGREQTFGEEELLVSKTDRQGRMTYANGAFLRVSGYTEAEAIGQPHSIIRHPDMPRAVFKLMWDTIEAGGEIFAYVLNLAKNGDHYWVLAHVTPTFGRAGEIVGYHSNRRSPDRAALAKIVPLYHEMLAQERGQASKVDQIAQGIKVLEGALASKGAPYEEFVFSL